MAGIDQEVREHIISMAGLLDCFGRRTKQQEELLWARAEEAAMGNEVVRLVLPLDRRISHLERRVTSLETKTTTAMIVTRLSGKSSYSQLQLLMTGWYAKFIVRTV